MEVDHFCVMHQLMRDKKSPKIRIRVKKHKQQTKKRYHVSPFCLFYCFFISHDLSTIIILLRMCHCFFNDTIFCNEKIFYNEKILCNEKIFFDEKIMFCR